MRNEIVEETKDKKEAGAAGELFFWAQALVFALVILVIMNVFFFRVSGVTGTSMVPTLENGDQLLIQLIGYSEPKRGDIIVVISDYFVDEPLIKRVIALSGDVIDINAFTGAVTVNGEELYEPYIAEKISNAGTIIYPYTVPEDHVFVMGDNRNRSSDSRVAAIGPLPYEHIIGKAIFRVWPFKSFGTL